MAAEKTDAAGSQVILDLPLHTPSNGPVRRAGSRQRLRIR